jgi:predicted TIM-barrel fold metal-dependent hydrolase
MMSGMNEVVLDPDIAICDPHHHLWDRADDRYMMEELTGDLTSGHRVERTVFVECGSSYRPDGPAAMRPVGETEFVVASDSAGLVQGIVGHADLRLRDIEDVLAAHTQAGQGRFRGIRHSSTWDASARVWRHPADTPPGLLGDTAFRSGIAALGQAELIFEAWLYHPQIPELISLACAYPGVSIVIDHLGGPLGVGPYKGRQAEVLEVWRRSICELARCPNVVMKLGGIGIPMYGTGWHRRPGDVTSDEIAALWRGPILHCVEQFGAERCMFESNFPVDKRCCSYRALWDGFKKIAAGASPTERKALFSGTAVRTYRL